MGGYSLEAAAGYLDGEGTFSARGRVDAEVKADSVDPKPLFALRELFGGSVHRGSVRSSFRKRATWRWRVTGDAARRTAMLLVPMLLTKRVEAEAVALSEAHPRGTPYGDWLRKRAADSCKAEYPEEIWT